MAPLFGAIASDGSSHISSSSVYSPYPPPLQPLRSSRARPTVAQPTVFQNIRSSIHSLFSTNASTIDASTPPPLPQFNTPKPQRLSVNTSQWHLPAFGFLGEEQDAPVMSANFSHGEPLYEPHPVVNFPSTTADQSPRLDETQRRPVNYRPLTPSTLAQLQPQTSANHTVQTPPAVYEVRRQSRLDMREILSEAGSNERVTDQPERHRRQFSGADREELILCHEIERRQRDKREKKRKNSAASGQSTNKTSSKKKSSKSKEKTWNGRYRPCLSSSNKRLRGKSIACFLTGGLLMVMVSTCKSSSQSLPSALTNRIRSRTSPLVHTTQFNRPRPHDPLHRRHNPCILPLPPLRRTLSIRQTSQEIPVKRAFARESSAPRP